MEKKVYEFISKQSHDPIVQRKTCAVSGKEFAIFQSDVDFYNKISPTFAGKKFQIPIPTLCPEERQRRRLAWRNERKLYRRNCDASNKQIISIYSSDKPYKVYEQPIWRSDSRDPLSYGKEFNSSQTFTQQMNEFIVKVPHPALGNEYHTLVNSEYNNQTGNLKNCYMLSNSDYDEMCLYGKGVNRCDKVVDAFKTYDSNNSYYTINCYNISFCFYIYNCKDCFQCYNCCNLIQCKFCINCSNLAGQEYCINNTHYSKEEYEKLAPQYRNNQLVIQGIQKNMDQIQTENCTGNFISQCRNSHLCYDVEGMDASKYCCDLKKGQSDSVLNYDVSYFGAGLNYCYEGNTLGYGISKAYFCSDSRGNANNLFYCYYCFDSSDCFGCVGLRNKSYCIFNKQHTKADYEKEVAKIIEHMQTTKERGEFLNPSMSPFGYNETNANEYFPLPREDALARGYKWQDKSYETAIMDTTKVLKGEQILADINKVEDSIVNEILICEMSERPYKITKQELEFYRKHNLPLPRKHPDIRHLERLNKRPGRELHVRTCDKCGIEMLSVYPQNSELKVYCEACYNKEVY